MPRWRFATPATENPEPIEKAGVFGFVAAKWNTVKNNGFRVQNQLKGLD